MTVQRGPRSKTFGFFRLAVIASGAALIATSLYFTLFRLGKSDGDARPDTVMLGEPRSDGQPIPLPRGALNEKVAPLTSWPAACTLLAEAEIESVFPHVDQLKVDETIIYPSNTSTSTQGRGRAVNPSCGYSMRLPGDKMATTVIRVDIKRVGRPDSNLEYFREVVHTIPHPAKEIAGARCGPTTLSFPEVACVKGGIVFSVLAYSGAVFEGNDVPSPVVWRDDVLPLIAEIIAADVRA